MSTSDSACHKKPKKSLKFQRQFKALRVPFVEHLEVLKENRKDRDKKFLKDLIFHRFQEHLSSPLLNDHMDSHFSFITPL